MTALWLSPDVDVEGVPTGSALPTGRGTGLQLVRPGLVEAWPDDADDPEPYIPAITLVPERRPDPRRRVSPAVRRRRALLAGTVALLIALALPLSGTGGHSHAAGSALAGNVGPVAYTVQPGDTLWTIAERVDPSADPRPLVAKLAAQTGSDTVVPGEHITLP
jgi:nucleoid-associated protein YgaU